MDTNWRSYGLGVISVIALIATIGGALAAIQATGTITIPTGKFAIYFFVNNADLTRFTTVYDYKYNTTLNQTAVLTHLNNDAKNCIVNIVRGGEARIAREAALKNAAVTS